MASRKEEKERRRLERLEKERELHQQDRRRRLYAIGTGGLLTLAAVAAVIAVVAAGGGGDGNGDRDTIGGGRELDATAVDPPPSRVDNLDAAARAARCELRNPPIEGREHVTTDPKYKTNPPTSGNHNPVPANDLAYGKAPKIPHLVHSLEHGRIVIYYDPSIGQRRIAQLKGLFDQDPYHLILAPNTEMPYEVAATAWGHLADCKRFNDQAFDVLRAFSTRYVDKAPEFVQ